MDFETPSGLSDAQASQKSVLESTRTHGSSQSLRLELSEITPSNSTPTNSTRTTETDGSRTSNGRIPFQSMLDELDIAEKTAIDEDILENDEIFRDMEKEDDDSFIDDQATEDWSESLETEDDNEDNGELLEIAELPKATSKSSIFKKQNPKKSKKDAINSMNLTIVSLGNTSALVCNACKVPFTNKSGFTRHSCKPSSSLNKSSLDVTILKCMDKSCTRIFTNNSALTRHLKVHNEDSHSSKETTSISTSLSRSNNSQATPNQTLKCDKCVATYKTELNLKKHIDTKHPENPSEITEKPFQCSSCSSSYVKEFNLKKHIVTKHKEVELEGVLENNEDGSAIGDKEDQNVQIHENLSANLDTEKPFQCFNCSSTYVKEFNLKKHIESKHKGVDGEGNDDEIHEEGNGKEMEQGELVGNQVRETVSEKYFSCERCNAQFVKEFNLNKHMESKHDVNAPVPRRRRSIETHKTKSSARSKRI